MRAADARRQLSEVLIRLSTGSFEQIFGGERSVVAVTQVVVILSHHDGIANLAGAEDKTVSKVFDVGFGYNVLAEVGPQFATLFKIGLFQNKDQLAAALPTFHAAGGGIKRQENGAATFR